MVLADNLTFFCSLKSRGMKLGMKLTVPGKMHGHPNTHGQFTRLGCNVLSLTSNRPNASQCCILVWLKKNLSSDFSAFKITGTRKITSSDWKNGFELSSNLEFKLETRASF